METTMEKKKITQRTLNTKEVNSIGTSQAVMVASFRKWALLYQITAHLK